MKTDVQDAIEKLSQFFEVKQEVAEQILSLLEEAIGDPGSSALNIEAFGVFHEIVPPEGLRKLWMVARYQCVVLVGETNSGNRAIVDILPIILPTIH